jgi:hypothetical protein
MLESEKMAKTVIVGCKLPMGIILENPNDASKKVTLNGKNKALIVGADFATTEVDGEFFEAWLAVNSEFPALKSGAIFVARSIGEAQAVAKDFEGVETGLEPMRTDGKDSRARGVKKADK